MILDLDGEDAVREREREQVQRMYEERAAAWEAGYDDAFAAILNDADEHNLDPEDVARIWTDALAKVLDSREPPTNQCCSTIGGHSPLCGG